MSRPSGQRRVSADGWTYAQSLRDAGHTLDAVGSALGVTRERVRQKTVQRPRASVADPIAIMRGVRDPDTTSVRGVAERLGHGVDTVEGCLQALGVYESALRLFRWRRLHPQRTRLAAVIVAEFQRLGRTPTLIELGAACGWEFTAGPVLRDVFGSIRRAMEYAGVPHRSRNGGPNKYVGAGRLLTLCRRGHALSGSNLYVSPEGARQCRACRRIRRAVAAQRSA